MHDCLPDLFAVVFHDARVHTFQNDAVHLEVESNYCTVLYWLEQTQYERTLEELTRWLSEMPSLSLYLYSYISRRAARRQQQGQHVYLYGARKSPEIEHVSEFEDFTT